MGEALAELLRKAIHPPPHFREKSAFPCFDVAEEAAPITLERTLEAEDEP